MTSAFAQFQFFEQMFGQGQQQQRQRPSGSAGASQWSMQSESVPCSQYLCPDTLVCVEEPALCPCPDVQDVRCLVPDAEDTRAAAVLCVRGAKGCADVERLARKMDI
ncbi:hypothetical protein CERSUDRAFT_80572 [Gelatoporia subvermispora B]|uniref:Long chronological lifespan protein 2 n=1 Tax=Ceriporiopsis subvermispora (strain B) TaxID=914234 RepID=M2RPY2_CERS8|nr:hypothetical protein CERSUDRAFT_80572 [Gelatoporia subvermispora B]